MNDFDRTLLALVTLAIVAVIVSSKQSAGAVTAIGQGVARLATNIVGKGAAT